MSMWQWLGAWAIVNLLFLLVMVRHGQRRMNTEPGGTRYF